jgi:hypothetical protein
MTDKSRAITLMEAADLPKRCQAMPNRGDQSLGQRQLQLNPIIVLPDLFCEARINPESVFLGKYPLSVRSAWYRDELFADAKDREQLLPPTTIVGFGSDAGAVKDGSPVAKIDPDRALVSFKEVPMTPVKAYHDTREVACGEIGVLTIERAALINDFEVP